MSNVSMELVKKLRDQTQVGMMDCKKALEEAQGDYDKAVELLRKKGAAVAAKRAENVTNHGRIEAFVTPDCSTGVMVESACETDFSANTEDMKTFLHDIASHIAQASPTGVETLMAQAFTGNTKITVKQRLDELVAKICENIKVTNFIRFTVQPGIVHAYVHPGSTVGVLVAFATDKDAGSHLEDLKTAAKDVCMQIAVNSPLCIDPSGLDAAVVNKEREIAREQLQSSGKPANVIDKIIEGKIGKFYQDACLLNQAFIKNDKQTIKQYLDEVSKKTGVAITVTQFKRFAIGR